MKKTKYRTIDETDGSFSAAQTAKKNKRFFCDAVNHHQKGGCPNPDCFAHQPGAVDKRE